MSVEQSMLVRVKEKPRKARKQPRCRPTRGHHGMRSSAATSARKIDLQDEVTRFLDVYNAAWENNWASVPLNEAEVRH